MKHVIGKRGIGFMALLLAFGLVGNGIAFGQNQFSIDYEKIVLDNGLEVVLHQDKSDPIVAVAVSVHVGSNREKPGRTGFAHFFEHMLFQKSENLPERAFFTKIDQFGGTFNGFTNTDNTVYFEVVPNDALEKVLWMESDRMGYFINAISTADMENEKGVVQNEKRQNYDNRPYGMQREAINKALYPEGHPYNWLTIGELEDLQNAQLADVQEFYQEWYGPNNATLVIAGDFDRDQTLAWVKKYFGEIPARGNPQDLDPMPVSLDETKIIYYEDNFAKLPRLTLTYPTVEEFNNDEAALDALGQILSQGKRSAMYKVMVEQYGLTSDRNMYAYNGSSELAGTFTLNVTANAGVDLDEAHKALMEALAMFEENGFDQRDLDRIKIGLETDFYNGISSVLNKAFQLARYNEFAGDPGYIEEAIKAIQSVTKEDVMRVYNKYIKGQPHIVSAWVPKDQLELAVEGAVKADVVEEDINNQYTTPENLEVGNTAMTKTPSAFDRSMEPAYGDQPLLTPPAIWTGELKNGMKLYGIEQSELPLVTFVITLEGGMLLDNPNKVGVANLITSLMAEGTAKKTPEELEDAIGQLGLNFNMYTGSEEITIVGNCLAKNLKASLELVQEILLQPRWDATEFERVKNETLTTIESSASNPNAIAGNVARRMMYGDQHILSNSTLGTTESVNSITLEDLKAYYNAYFTPSLANFHIAGAVSQEETLKMLKSWASKWKAKEVTIPTFEANAVPTSPQMYFVDVPGARQSVIQIRRLLPEITTNEAYYQMVVANDRLGGGSSGELFRVLREERKYSYGAYSGLGRNASAPNSFFAAGSVQSSVTAEAVEAFNDVIAGYPVYYNADMLESTQESIIRSNTRNYETLSNLIGILSTMSSYDLDANYIDKQQEIVNNITVEEVKNLADTYMDLNKMIYIIVGDGETQLPKLKEAGFNPIEVDADGNPVE